MIVIMVLCRDFLSTRQQQLFVLQMLITSTIGPKFYTVLEKGSLCHVNKALKVFTKISHKGLDSTCTSQIVDDITTKTCTTAIYNQHKSFMFLLLYKPRDLNNNCLVLPFNQNKLVQYISMQMGSKNKFVVCSSSVTTDQCEKVTDLLLKSRTTGRVRWQVATPDERVGSACSLRVKATLTACWPLAHSSAGAKFMAYFCQLLYARLGLAWLRALSRSLYLLHLPDSCSAPDLTLHAE